LNLKPRLKSCIDIVDPILRETKIVLHGMRKDLFSFAGIIITTFFIGIALTAPLIAPPEPNSDPYILRIREDWKGAPGITPPPTPPSPEHPFGTLAGYDIYYGCIWGTRTAFRISLQVTFIALTIGFLVGCVAGYFGGFLDGFLMLLTDLFFGLPSILFAMLLIVATISQPMGDVSFSFYAHARMNAIVLALGVTGWPAYARLIRGEVMRVKNENYVETAKAIGCSNFRIIARHILPNSISPVIAMASLNIGGVVLTVATLSFLGIGIPLGYAAWAPFIAKSRHYIISPSFEHAYTFMIPSVFLVTFILGWTLLGDALRDVQDPRIRRT